MPLDPPYIHPAAEVSPEARVGAGTRIWRLAAVRAGASVGEECNIGQGTYIDAHVTVGSRVKIQNYCSLFEGLTVEDGVFIGPHVCFTNDLFPRAITPEGQLKGAEDWEVTPTLVRYGASIGAGSVIRCGVTIGRFALIGAGAVVTHDVPAHALVFGNPARQQGWVCSCARRLTDLHEEDGRLIGVCASVASAMISVRQSSRSRSSIAHPCSTLGQREYPHDPTKAGAIVPCSRFSLTWRCLAVIEEAIRARPAEWFYWAKTDTLRDVGLLPAPPLRRTAEQSPSPIPHAKDGLLSGVPAKHQQAFLKILLTTSGANDRAV